MFNTKLLQNLAICLLSLFVLVPAQAQTQPIFQDQFDGPELDIGKWTFHGPRTVNGIDTGGNDFLIAQTGDYTRHGFKPSIQSEPGATFVRLRLDTVNPQYPGFFKGTIDVFTQMKMQNYRDFNAYTLTII